MSKDFESKEGNDLWYSLLKVNISVFWEVKDLLMESENERITKLFPLFMCIMDDLISLDLLLKNNRLNQSYIISRALLERTINYCYLLYADTHEYENYVLYSKNKAARRLSRKIEVNGKKYASIEYNGGEYELNDEYLEAMNAFTGKNGKENTRWTSLNIDKRAAFLDDKFDKNLLFHVMTIYGDASEALHGTLYGATFQLGIYEPKANPITEKSLKEEIRLTVSFLLFMACHASGTLLSTLSEFVEGILPYRDDMDNQFMITSKKTGLDVKSKK